MHPNIQKSLSPNYGPLTQMSASAPVSGWLRLSDVTRYPNTRDSARVTTTRTEKDGFFGWAGASNRRAIASRRVLTTRIRRTRQNEKVTQKLRKYTTFAIIQGVPRQMQPKKTMVLIFHRPSSFVVLIWIFSIFFCPSSVVLRPSTFIFQSESFLYFFERLPSSFVGRHLYFISYFFLFLYFVGRPSSFVGRHSYFNVKGFLYYFVDRPSSFVGRHSYFKNCKDFLKYEGRRTTDEIIIKRMKKMKKYEGRPTKDDGRNNNNNKKMKKKYEGRPTKDDGRRSYFYVNILACRRTTDDGRTTKKIKKDAEQFAPFRRPSSVDVYIFFPIFLFFFILSVVRRPSSVDIHILMWKVFYIISSLVRRPSSVEIFKIFKIWMSTDEGRRMTD